MRLPLPLALPLPLSLPLPLPPTPSPNPNPNPTPGQAAAAALDTRWREVVAPETGAASYEALYEQVNGRPFPIPLPRLLQHADI